MTRILCSAGLTCVLANRQFQSPTTLPAVSPQSSPFTPLKTTQNGQERSLTLNVMKGVYCLLPYATFPSKPQESQKRQCAPTCLSINHPSLSFHISLESHSIIPILSPPSLHVHTPELEVVRRPTTRTTNDIIRLSQVPIRSRVPNKQVVIQLSRIQSLRPRLNRKPNVLGISPAGACAEFDFTERVTGCDEVDADLTYRH